MGLFNNSNEDAGNKRKGGGLRQMYKLAKPSLSLSPDQETKIESTLSQLREKRASIKSSGNDNREEMRAARQQARQQVMEVLNPDQKKIWKDNVKTWREQREGPLK